MLVKSKFVRRFWLLCFVVAIVVGPQWETSTYASSGETIRIDPQIRYQTLEGWGTNLSWGADIVGGWQGVNKQRVADLLFKPYPSGLGFDIVRYGIHGGSDPALTGTDRNTNRCTEDTFRAGAFTDSFQTDALTWNWSADPDQRWMLMAAKELGVERFDAVAYAPPYWMTKSGCGRGIAYSPPMTDYNNLKDEHYADFAEYLTEVAYYFYDQEDIHFESISPMNEPAATWWNMGQNQLYNSLSGQEGAHFDRSKQNVLIKQLALALADKQAIDPDFKTTVSATDENDVDDAVASFDSYDSTAKAAISRVNTHSYNFTPPAQYPLFAQQRSVLNSMAAAEGKALWMTEFGTGYHRAGETLLSKPYPHKMDAGLLLAEHLISDMKTLQPTAWFPWATIEEKTESGWGLIQAYASEAFEVTKQYYAMQHFTAFIDPGYTFIGIDDGNGLAAFSEADQRLVIVIHNNSETNRPVTFDLSGFAGIPAMVDKYRTAFYAQGATHVDEEMQASTMSTTASSLSDTLIGKSIQTYVFEGIADPGIVQIDQLTVDDSDRFDSLQHSSSLFFFDYYNASAIRADWATAAYAGAHQGAVRRSADEGAYFELVFVGEGIALYGRKAGDHGKADVYVNGVFQQTIETYSTSSEDKALLYETTGLDYGEHTIRVVIKESGKYVAADYAVIDTGVIHVNDNQIGAGHQQFRYVSDVAVAQSYDSKTEVDGWIYYSGSGDYMRDNHYSFITGDYYEMKFNGSKIVLRGPRAANQGKANIYIDNNFVQKVDFRAVSGAYDQVLYESPLLEYGEHIIKVEVTGETSGGPTDVIIPADRAIIYGAVRVVNDNDSGSGPDLFQYYDSAVPWGYYDGQSGAYRSDNHYSDEPGNYYEIEFTGSEVSVYGSLAPNNGYADIYVNGSKQAELHLYRSSRLDNVRLFSSGRLPYGSHVLRVQVADANTTGYYVPADRVVITK